MLRITHLLGSDGRIKNAVLSSSGFVSQTLSFVEYNQLKVVCKSLLISKDGNEHKHGSVSGVCDLKKMYFTISVRAPKFYTEDIHSFKLNLNEATILSQC